MDTTPATSGDTAAVIFSVIVLAGLAVYLAPTIVAAIRRVPHAGSVAAINLLLGWSLVGWAVAWALALRSRPQQVRLPRVAAPVAAPAGWYPDPLRAGRLRFWTGQNWTDSVTGGAGPAV
jgi:Superinfection immunity protein/Protein of unknown function (DUF2510)